MQSSRNSPIEKQNRGTAVLWSIGIFAPLSLFVIIRALPDLATADPQAVIWREIALLVLAVGALGGTYRFGVLSPAEMGLRAITGGDVLWSLGAALLMLFMSLTISVAQMRLGFPAMSTGVVQALGKLPTGALLLVALTAAVSEEAVFRSISLASLKATGNGTVLALVVSAACFSLPHIVAYGPAKLPVTFAHGLIMGILFIRLGSLPACIMTHALIDLIGLTGLIVRSLH